MSKIEIQLRDIARHQQAEIRALKMKIERVRVKTEGMAEAWAGWDEVTSWDRPEPRPGTGPYFGAIMRREILAILEEE